jgi:hypothetical protein
MARALSPGQSNKGEACHNPDTRGIRGFQLSLKQMYRNSRLNEVKGSEMRSLLNWKRSFVMRPTDSRRFLSPAGARCLDRVRFSDAACRYGFPTCAS